MATPGEQLGAAFEKIFDLVRSQFRAADDLMVIIEEYELHLFESDDDIRNSNPEDDPELGNRIWVVPGRNVTDGVWSSDMARFERRFEIGIGTGSLDSAIVHKIEGIITALLFQLHRLRDPQGEPLAIDIAPLTLESILIGSVDHEREPILEPEEIQAIAEVTVVAHGPLSLLAPPAPTPVAELSFAAIDLDSGILQLNYSAAVTPSSVPQQNELQAYDGDAYWAPVGTGWSVISAQVIAIECEELGAVSSTARLEFDNSASRVLDVATGLPVASVTGFPLGIA